MSNCGLRVTSSCPARPAPHHWAALRCFPAPSFPASCKTLKDLLAVVLAVSCVTLLLMPILLSLRKVLEAFQLSCPLGWLGNTLRRAWTRPDTEERQPVARAMERLSLEEETDGVSQTTAEEIRESGGPFRRPLNHPLYTHNKDFYFSSALVLTPSGTCLCLYHVPGGKADLNCVDVKVDSLERLRQCWVPGEEDGVWCLISIRTEGCPGLRSTRLTGPDFRPQLPNLNPIF